MESLEVVALGSRGRAALWGRRFDCALGRGGVTAAKREGDGATPLGSFRLTALYYRAERVQPLCPSLPMRPLHPDDGWCDAPLDPAYNRPVRHPWRSSAERLWRRDRLYDLIVTTDQNSDPVEGGAGSAIFLHIARPGFAPTEGCIAFAREDLLWILANLPPAPSVSVLAGRSAAA